MVGARLDDALMEGADFGGAIYLPSGEAIPPRPSRRMSLSLLSLIRLRVQMFLFKSRRSFARLRH